MKHARALLLSFCVLALASCQTWEGAMEDLGAIDIPTLSSNSDFNSSSEDLITSGRCPATEIVDELSMMNEYTDLKKPQASNLISGVVLTQAESKCSYSGKSATVDIKLAFEGTLGPRARVRADDKPFFSYPFFVAVTAPNGDILAKEVFSAPLTYDAGQNSQTYYESMRQIIPIANPGRGNRYKVLVGFQLSQPQLDQNRLVLEEQRLQMEAEKAKQQVVIQQQPLQQQKAAAPANAIAPAAGADNTGPISITPRETEE